jgi:hypothetical protein
MAKITKEYVLKTVTAFYLESHDFNGISTWTLSEKFKQDWALLKMVVRELIEDEMLGLIDTNTDVNPHIIRRGFEPKDIQISKLDSESPPAYLSFDLSVLEFYRNDPRYRYENDDIRGHIYYDAEEMKDSDKALLETYGFSYDDDYNRAVAVFLCYLTDLTPEHQQIWKAKELPGNYKLHPDYYRNMIIGDWGEKVPICSALLKELYIINQMAKAMGRPPLFKDDYGEYGENMPKRFGFLIRPTLEEFNNFILLFDKMLSDNINQDFFQKEVSYEIEIERKDGKIQVQQKGRLQILDYWIRRFFRTHDWQPWEESIATFRKISLTKSISKNKEKSL